MTSDLMELCMKAYYATSNWERHDSRIRWVMDRSSYNRLRAETMTEDQEMARAQAHASVWISAEAQPPYRCPVCPAGPFTSMRELTGHTGAMADPANREPDDHDQLFGIAINVRDGGGVPHLELAP